MGRKSCITLDFNAFLHMLAGGLQFPNE